ncbi:MAG: hypothetical protein JEY79_01165 [Pseudodesulfovibrio sp.]|nr:hypothetical protein [Pseudodesulfovibrio sp.]
MSKDFELYGEGWRKELMQFKKAELIDLFRDLCLTRDRLKTMQEQTGARAEDIRKNLVFKMDTVEAMRKCAVKALNLSKDENAECKACGHGGGEHGADCPIATLLDIPLMVVDFDLHGREYLEENGG